jgi:hypothetical protein
MAALLYALTTACDPDGAGGTLSFRAGSTGKSPDPSNFSWTLDGPAGAYPSFGSYDEPAGSAGPGGSYGPITQTFDVVPLPNGDYTLVVTNERGDTRSQAFTIACANNAAGSGPEPLRLDSLTATPAPSATGVGTINVQASGGTGPYEATLLVYSIFLPFSAQAPAVFRDRFPGAYVVLVADAKGNTVEGTVTVGIAVINGCTDPSATNYDPAATAENGSCAYAPPAPLAPLFAVPPLQALRFALRGGAFETPDNTLFCEQVRPGQQRRPFYYQLVQTGDAVRVQVLTSFAGAGATLWRHGGAQVGAPVPLAQVLTLDGAAPPLPVVLNQDPATNTTRLRAAAGGSLPAALLAASRLTLAGPVSGTYRVTAAVPGTVVVLDDYVVLNRPWAAPAAGAQTASWLLVGPGYNVWEADLPVATLGEGYYQVRLQAFAAGGAVAAEAISEPVHVAAAHPNTVVVAWRNADNCFGTVFSTGLTPQVRVWGTFFRGKNGGTESTYRGSAGALTVLASTAQRLRTLETYAQPAWLHEKLYLACRLDYLAVNGLRCQTDQAYAAADERTYPLSAGSVVLEQADWLGAGNGDDAGVDETAPEDALQLRSSEYLLLRGH